MSDFTMDYGWRTAVAPHSADYLIPAVQRLLEQRGARRVLDLGCGNGALCGALALRGHEVVGVDQDECGLSIARTAYPALRFHCIGIDEDPGPLVELEGRFDAVVSTEVIEHLFAPHRLPRFAAPLVAPGGALVLSTPYHGYLKNLALSLADRWDHHHTALWHGGHIKFWSRATLSLLLRENGFEVVGFRGIGRAPYLWKSMLLVAEPRPVSVPAGLQ